MDKQSESKTLTAVVITALVVAGISYFVWGKDQVQSAPVKAETSSAKNITLNKSSKEYAVMGREVWSAFSCSAWASMDKNEAEAERLFTFGYDQGRTFLAAIQANKIDKEDASQQIPIGVSMLLQGPSEEFVLGRIFETSQDEALKDVFKTRDEYNSDEMQKIIAGNKFRDGNCQLIGK